MYRRSTMFFAIVCAWLIGLAYRHRKRLKKLLEKDRLAHIPKLVDAVEQKSDFIKTLFALSKSAQSMPRGLGRIPKLGPRRRDVIILTRPEHVTKVLANSTAHGMGILREATQNFIGKKSLFALEGDEWRTQRLIMRNALHSSRVQTTFSVAIENVCFRMVTRLAEKIKSNSVVDVHAMFARMHMSIVTKAFFGDDFGFFREDLYPTYTMSEAAKQGSRSAREEILTSFEYLLRELPKLAVDEKVRASPREFLDHDADWNFYSEQARSACRTAVRDRVQSRLAFYRATPRDNEEKVLEVDVLDEMIDSQREVAPNDDENALIEVITDNVVQLLFAGFNTNVVTMSFALFYLVQNPAWWDQVRAEADAIFSTRDFSQALNKESLPVLNAVISETLRLVPPTGFTARMLEEDLALEPDLILPKDSDIFLPIVFLAQQECYWGRDATAFNPRRWLDRPLPPAGAYLPFSAGPRSCIGESFARKSALIGLSMLIHFFTFELVPGAKQAPQWTGFGIRPVETNFGVALNLRVGRRRTTKSYSMQRRSSSNAARFTTESDDS